MKKKIMIFVLAVSLCLSCLAGCGGGKKNSKGVVKIYNWGEYIDEEVIQQFEDETGIEVIYDTFETNEEMYPIIEAGGTSYDAVCPSDYMIEKMIKNDLLSEINFDNIPNMKYISESIMEGSKAFDPENKYSVPYTFGTLGILYNTTMVEEPVTSWNALWNEKYKGEILMYNSPRDLFTAPLELLGYSINTTDEAQLGEAKELLLEQKPLLQRYVMDQIKDIMISGSAAMAMAYSGEVLQLQEANPDLAYVVPEEGSNYFIDSWVIPANSENKENAEAWINFLNDPEIALKNFEYITYSTPNTGAQELMDQALLENPAVFPGEEILKKCEVFHSLGEEGDTLFNDLWLEIKDAAVKS
ncbi:spermidine/putrescine ABC transporter substrate-binding protein [Lacrimispora sp. NSJ-141]|uniref:Spermidine/putrescine ABC transporter substrate-binding protein n=1 Tax=Lientehia hominis TaxID=2897778 RepID=A0AAP2W9J0_9FIRM|nr:spermidine/putrescine ABC transporter substrate-binding protein [Lientehia hominis]MCD2491799.1 spermidine/putrescine ABC transporter substrate-binding protein [Lientehia hominis]